jgi:hypothetical protein
MSELLPRCLGRCAYASLLFVSFFFTPFNAVATPPADELAATTIRGARSIHAGPVHSGARMQALTAGVKSAARFGGPVPGIDSLANFTGQFTANGVDWSGQPQSTWSYAMVGRSPARGGTTRIRAPIIPVSVDLRDSQGAPRYSGGVRLYSDAKRYTRPVLDSPIFVPAKFPGSETPLQYNDAVQRAEFYSAIGESWHTLLTPAVGKPLVMTISQDAACGTVNPDNSPGHCNYYYAMNADGSCCFYILVDDAVFTGLLYPFSSPLDRTSIIGAAELSGDMNTTDITSFVFPDTYLYVGDPLFCCILGYHSFDYEPPAEAGGLPRFYVMNYSSWVTPGVFGDAFADITVLSHELSEIFNDPFVVFDGVTNTTPWWLAPNGMCENILEDGDATEMLPNATYPIKTRGRVYHPQNEALLPWFAFQSPSPALGGAYSYPDATVLTALSVPQNAGCSAPL